MKRPRRSLDLSRPIQVRHCVECGSPFPSQWRSGDALYCSRACVNRAWRAIGTLAGTHGYVDGRFVRLVQA